MPYIKKLVSKTKTCNKCGKTKSKKAGFYRRKKVKNPLKGQFAHCKKCSTIIGNIKKVKYMGALNIKTKLPRGYKRMTYKEKSYLFLYDWVVIEKLTRKNNPNRMKRSEITKEIIAKYRNEIFVKRLIIKLLGHFRIKGSDTVYKRKEGVFFQQQKLKKKGFKVCQDCKKKKQLKEFYRTRTITMSSRCKPCDKIKWQKETEDLADSYIIKRLRREGFRCDKDNIPDDLIKARRMIIKIRRFFKQVKREKKNER